MRAKSNQVQLTRTVADKMSHSYPLKETIMQPRIPWTFLRGLWQKSQLNQDLRDTRVSSVAERGRNGPTLAHGELSSAAESKWNRMLNGDETPHLQGQKHPWTR